MDLIIDLIVVLKICGMILMGCKISGSMSAAIWMVPRVFKSTIRSTIRSMYHFSTC